MGPWTRRTQRRTDDRSGTGPGTGDPQPVVPRIEVEALTKRFGTKAAVDGVDLVIEPGTFLVLLGPSGSGKSTMLRCLAGIERVTSGTIRFGSLQVDGPGGHLPPERRELAMVFQDYALWPHLTAADNVGFALKRRGMAGDERQRRARAMLDDVGLAGLHDRYPGQLSGGEQQRVALARALVGRPGLLLFDEPLSNLDADRRERLRVDIGAMVRAQGATAVYITHDQAEAFALADVVGVLRDGRLVQVGPSEDVYRNPADDFVARFTGLAGELPGRVVDTFGRDGVAGPGAGDAWVAVDVGGSLVRGRPVGGASLRPGHPVRVLVRPSALRFTGPAGAEVGWRHPDGPGVPTSAVPVVVRDAAFRGWGYEHLVEGPGGHRLAGVQAGVRLPFASRANVELSADGCLVAADAEAAGASGEATRRVAAPPASRLRPDASARPRVPA